MSQCRDSRLWDVWGIWPLITVRGSHASEIPSQRSSQDNSHSGMCVFAAAC